MPDWFTLGNVWSFLVSMSSFLYHVAGIILIIGLLTAYKQFKEAIKQTELAQQQLASSIIQTETMQKDMEVRSKRASVEYSLKYLRMFASEMIIEIDNYTDNFEKENGQPPSKMKIEKSFLIDPDSLEEPQLIELALMTKGDVHHIANKLEYFSIGIINGLADEDICFTPLAKMFCGFVERNYLFFAVRRFEKVPFEGIVKLYEQWSMRLKYEESRLKKEIAENMMKEAEGFAKSQPIS